MAVSDDFIFQFSARAAMMQENMRTVMEYMTKLVEDHKKTQELIERISKGDVLAFAELMKDFDRQEHEFSRMAEIIRSF